MDFDGKYFHLKKIHILGCIVLFFSGYFKYLFDDEIINSVFWVMLSKLALKKLDHPL